MDDHQNRQLNSINSDNIYNVNKKNRNKRKRQSAPPVSERLEYHPPYMTKSWSRSQDSMYTRHYNHQNKYNYNVKLGQAFIGASLTSGRHDETPVEPREAGQQRYNTVQNRHVHDANGGRKNVNGRQFNNAENTGRFIDANTGRKNLNNRRFIDAENTGRFSDTNDVEETGGPHHIDVHDRRYNDGTDAPEFYGNTTTIPSSTVTDTTTTTTTSTTTTSPPTPQNGGATRTEQNGEIIS